MSALLKKEIRVLLPSFALACVVTPTLLFIQQGAGPIAGALVVLPSVICPALVIMMALNSFGVEVSSGTFSSLLSQPISRLKIWQTKIVLLAISLISISVLWFGMLGYRETYLDPDHPTGLADFFTGIAIFALVVFSGSLWTVLLLRQVAAAFWFTLLIPGMFLVVLEGLLAASDDYFREGMVVIVLGLYSLAGLFYARWLFMRAQDLQWTGGSIVMPEVRGLARFKETAAAARHWRPNAALWLKEFQLHQSQYVIGFVLVVLHLGVLAVRKFHDLSNSHDLKFVLEIFWGIWLVMPVLVGCTAVAEERKIGTLEGQLCLPVKRSKQFRIKLAVVLCLSMFFGALMPLLLEGTRILPDLHLNLGSLTFGVGPRYSPAAYFMWYCLAWFNGWIPILTFAGAVSLMGIVSFYISTLTRNTLQSLAPAVMALAVMFFLLLSAPLSGLYDTDFLWRGPLPYFIALPIFLLALLWLAHGNFNQARISWSTGRRNLLGLTAALVVGVVLTAAVYHRAWGKLTPFEPAHGTAQLQLPGAVRLNTDRDQATVWLPGGRLWIAQFAYPPYNPPAWLLNNIQMKLDRSTFIADSNWLDLKYGYHAVVGIKTDGTLWVLEKPDRGVERLDTSGPANDDNLKHLDQFGTDTNWTSLVIYGPGYLLAKNDGTLWRWGPFDFDVGHHVWPGIAKFQPERLGTDSDWAQISQDSYHRIFLRKNDGSLWTWPGDLNNSGHSVFTVEPGFTFSAVVVPNHMEFRSWTQISVGLDFKVGVRSDGTFRIWADERQVHEHHGNYEWFSADKQIGNGTNWVAVAGNWKKIVTLKDDGTLWLWNFRYDYRRGWDPILTENEIQGIRPIRLGTHSDWIAISGDNHSVCTLAADGSLWYWQLEDLRNYNDYGDAGPIGPLLDFSHKPQFLANVLSGNN
jgi:ABC-type transport system involved in multi-copper enzyme maturation permease subunit